MAGLALDKLGLEVKAVTRAELTALCDARLVIPNRVYLISDENRIAIGTTTSAFIAMAVGELGGGTPFAAITPPTIAPSLFVAGRLEAKNGTYPITPDSFAYSWDRKVFGDATWTGLSFGAYLKYYDRTPDDYGYLYQMRERATLNGIDAPLPYPFTNTSDPTPPGFRNVSDNAPVYNFTIGQTYDIQIDGRARGLLPSTDTVIPGLSKDLSSAGILRLTGTVTAAAGPMKVIIRSALASDPTKFFESALYIPISEFDYAVIADKTAQRSIPNAAGGNSLYTIQSATSPISIMAEKTRSNMYLFTVADDFLGSTVDPDPYDKYRSELEGVDRFQEHVEYWFADRWRVKGASLVSAASGKSYAIPHQIHKAPLAGETYGTPPFVLEHRKSSAGQEQLIGSYRYNENLLQNNNAQNITTTIKANLSGTTTGFPMVSGEFNNVVICVKFDHSGADSYLYIWLNGVNIWAEKNVKIGYNDDGQGAGGAIAAMIYEKFGIYTAPRQFIDPALPKPADYFMGQFEHEVIPMGVTSLIDKIYRARNPANPDRGRPIYDPSSKTLDAFVGTDGVASITPAGLRLEGEGVENKNPWRYADIGYHDPAKMLPAVIPISFESTPEAMSAEVKIGLVVSGQLRWYSNTLAANQRTFFFNSPANGIEVAEGTYMLQLAQADFNRYEVDGALGTYTNGTMPTGLQPVKLMYRVDQEATSTDNFATYGSSSSSNARTTFGKLYAAAAPNVVDFVPTGDDCEITHRTIVAPMFQALASGTAKMTLFFNPRAITFKGTTFNYATNKLTIAQWQELAAMLNTSGSPLVDIGCGSPSDASDTAASLNITSAQDYLDMIKLIQQQIKDNGMVTGPVEGNRGYNHRCYSGATTRTGYDLLGYTGKSNAITGVVLTQGSNSFTLATAPTTAIVVGQRIRAFNLPIDTFVGAVSSDGKTVTMTKADLTTPQNALGNGTVKMAFQDYSNIWFRGKMQKALRDSGLIKLQRATGVSNAPSVNFFQYGFLGIDMTVLSGSMNYSNTPNFTTAQTQRLANAKKYGTAEVVHFHLVTDTDAGGTTIRQAQLQEWADSRDFEVRAGRGRWMSFTDLWTKYGAAVAPS